MQKRFHKIYIEISNICNFQCEFCPEVIRSKKTMSTELFNQALTQAAPLTEEVCFHLMGEPLLHPEFSEFVAMAEKLNVPVNITSNGALLNAAREETLLNPTIRQVNFSLHSFEANFPEKDVRGYLSKIFSFTKKAMVVRPDLYINFRLWNLRTDEEPSAMTKTIYSQIEKEFGFTFKNINVGWKKSKKISGRLYLHFDSRFQWPSLHLPIISDDGFCYGLKSHIGILADGTVVPCCLDKEGIINLGNIQNHLLTEIINSDRAQKILNGFSNGQRTEELCQKCSFINRFDSTLRKGGVHAADVVVGIHGLK